MKCFDHQSGAYIENDGANIYYEVMEKKNAPVILFLHGGFGTMNDFEVFIEELSASYTLVGIDSRGHGKSTLGSKELTYAQLQSDVTKVLDQLKITELSIIGFSDGGIVAYRLAMLSSLKINKLVTISSRWNIKDALLTKDIFLGMTGDSYSKKFPDIYQTYQKLNPESDYNRLTSILVKMWLDPNPTAYLNEKLADLKLPLLIVHGDNDHLLTRQSVVELANLVEGSHLLNIPFATHPAFKDQQEIFMAGLRAFLKIDN